jgi:hypothetical protein
MSTDVPTDDSVVSPGHYLRSLASRTSKQHFTESLAHRTMASYRLQMTRSMTLSGDTSEQSNRLKRIEPTDGGEGSEENLLPQSSESQT